MPTDDLAKLLGETFVERRDVFAVQQGSGAYFPERRPIKMGDLRDHLAGRRTIGHYVTSEAGRARTICFDIDLAQTATWSEGPIAPRAIFADSSDPRREVLATQLNAAALVLARTLHRQADIHVVASWSGSKGLHVTGLTGSEPAEDLRSVALFVLKECGWSPSRGKNFYRLANPAMALECEPNPKQSTLEGKDWGNLLRLELGRNRKTNAECYFVRLDPTRYHFGTFTPMNPVDALTGTLPW
jgi:hypothetical protein